MKNTLIHYKQNRGLIYRTSDGHKYLVSRRKGNQIYFKRVLFRSSCKSTAKLSQESNLIILLADHKNGIDLYNDDIYLIKAKCKEAAKSSGKIYARFSMMSLAEGNRTVRIRTFRIGTFRIMDILYNGHFV